MITVYDMTSGEFLERSGETDKVESRMTNPSATHPGTEAVHDLYTPGVETGLQESPQEEPQQKHPLPTELVDVDCEHFISSMED
jgi:hypothetical protein